MDFITLIIYAKIGVEKGERKKRFTYLLWSGQKLVPATVLIADHYKRVLAKI